MFPEDGVYGTKFTRESIKPYLEEIPNPKKLTANPCTEGEHKHLYVQNRLSCMARKYSIYIIANVGDKVPCNKETEPKCPSDGQFQYNTNVAYSPEGQLVARYHKRNLFYEMQFDTPEIEYSTFDTEFGKVGTMTCFDVLFKEPALGLIEKHKIQHMAFPTAWGNAWPHLYSIQFHQSFGIRMGVNFLEAGFHRPERMTGSGVYAGNNGAQNVYFNETIGSKGSLVISRMPRIAEAPKKTHIPDIVPVVNQSSTFQGLVHRDLYSMIEVNDTKGNISIKSKAVSCHLSFKRKEHSHDKEMYVLAAFDGLHFSSLNWYIQSCILLKCAKNDRMSCGAQNMSAVTVFEEFQLSGQFETKYVYPSVMSNDTNMANSEWTYYLSESDPNRAMIRSNGAMTQPLVVASLYGRHYERDDNYHMSSDPASDASVRQPHTLIFLICVGFLQFMKL